MANLRRSLVEKQIPLFETVMTEREAFRAMFSFQQPLGELNASEVPGIDKAIANADAFAAELVAKLHPAAGGGE